MGLASTLFWKPGGRESSADVRQLPPNFGQGAIWQGGVFVRLQDRQLLLDELEAVPQDCLKEHVERAIRNRR